jgi:hypothetical protein
MPNYNSKCIFFAFVIVICTTVRVGLRPTRRLSVPYNHKSQVMYCTHRQLCHRKTRLLYKITRLHYSFNSIPSILPHPFDQCPASIKNSNSQSSVVGFVHLGFFQRIQCHSDAKVRIQCRSDAKVTKIILNVLFTVSHCQHCQCWPSHQCLAPISLEAVFRQSHPSSHPHPRHRNHRFCHKG